MSVGTNKKVTQSWCIGATVIGSTEGWSHCHGQFLDGHSALGGALGGGHGGVGGSMGVWVGAWGVWVGAWGVWVGAWGCRCGVLSITKAWEINFTSRGE